MMIDGNLDDINRINMEIHKALGYKGWVKKTQHGLYFIISKEKPITYSISDIKDYEEVNLEYAYYYILKDRSEDFQNFIEKDYNEVIEYLKKINRYVSISNETNKWVCEIIKRSFCKQSSIVSRASDNIIGAAICKAFLKLISEQNSKQNCTE